MTHGVSAVKHLDDERSEEVDITIDETRLAQVMRDAANVLRNDGWAQGDLYVRGEGYCAFGACWKVLGLDHADDMSYHVSWDDIATENYIVGAINQYFMTNRDRFVTEDDDAEQYIWTLAEWNDHVARSAEDVIAWFETEADNIERAAR